MQSIIDNTNVPLNKRSIVFCGHITFVQKIYLVTGIDVLRDTEKHVIPFKNMNFNWNFI